MSDKPSHGRTFWDFCAERPVVLLFALFLIGVTGVGTVLLFRAESIHSRFHIGPQAGEVANHEQ